MVDSANQSLADFVFASKTRKFATGKQRHVTDAFRTVCWFHHLRRATGARTTYQMDKLVEIDDALTPREPQDKKNKWRSYSHGRHTPSPQLVQEIDGRFPEAAHLLNHPVWPALRIDGNTEEQVKALLIQVHPDVFAVIHSKSWTGHTPLTLNGWNKRRLRALEHHVSLDTLASLVLLLRLASNAGESKLAFEFGASVCRVLLMMGSWLTAHGIARPLAEYLAEHVLVLGQYNGQYHCLGEVDFVKASHQLAWTAKVVEVKENKRLTHRMRAGLLIDLLDEKFTKSFSDLIVTRAVSPADSPALNNSRSI